MLAALGKKRNDIERKVSGKKGAKKNEGLLWDAFKGAREERKEEGRAVGPDKNMQTSAARCRRLSRRGAGQEDCNVPLCLDGSSRGAPKGPERDPTCTRAKSPQ